MEVWWAHHQWARQPQGVRGFSTGRTTSCIVHLLDTNIETCVDYFVHLVRKSGVHFQILAGRACLQPTVSESRVLCAMCYEAVKASRGSLNTPSPRAVPYVSPAHANN